MIAALLTGAGAGLGLWLITSGVRPPRPALADALAALREPPAPRAIGRRRAYTGLAAPLASLGLPRTRVRQDLALLQRDTVTHLAEQAAATLFGLLLLPAALVALGARGQVPVWLALIGGAIGFRWADTKLHAEAEKRRAQLRTTLSAMLDLLTISLAGGAGLEQALDDAAGICTGWAANRLRQVIAAARILREPPWAALGQLGHDTAVTELAELGATMALAGSEGSRIRGSLAARAAAMRGSATADMEAAAEKASGRMSMPLLVLGLAYLLFLLFPPIASFGSGL
ncbi:MAG: tight adherence protein [Cryptosporangiaceae bacterium]|jgi:Flp pilus assembly protein TadB|nr:tight adherence protein [Cryptosporangiaceae bacterium]